MKKYIRTKDGIYEVIKNDFGVGIKIDCMFILLDDIKDKIIDQADTIKELCDEFVVVPNAPTVRRYKPRLWNFDFEKLVSDWSKSKRITIVYGAIWVDGKGLIYVAKLNEAGKLVLI